MSISPLSDHRDLEDALWDWCSKNVPNEVEVIWAKPNAPRPCEPYVTLNIFVVSRKSGQDSWELVDDDPGVQTFNIGGQRYLSLSVIAYGPSQPQQNQGGPSAQKLIEDLRDSLENPYVIGSLRSKGIAVHNEPTVNDISTMLETGFQDRSNMDVVFGYVQNRKVTVDTITSVETEGTLEGSQTQDVTLVIE